MRHLYPLLVLPVLGLEEDGPTCTCPFFDQRPELFFFSLMKVFHLVIFSMSACNVFQTVIESRFQKSEPGQVKTPGVLGTVDFELPCIQSVSRNGVAYLDQP